MRVDALAVEQVNSGSAGFWVVSGPSVEAIGESIRVRRCAELEVG